MSAKIQILSNTNYPLVDVLRSELMDSNVVRIAVAFLRKSGIDKIREPLTYALQEKGATIEIIVGLDFKTTDAKALMILKEIESNNKNFDFFCFGDRAKNYNELVFHPKIYLFSKRSPERTGFTSIIGSSNLTGGGLTTNFEVNSIFREDTPKYYNQLNAIYEEIKYTNSIFKPNLDYIAKYGNIQRQVNDTDMFFNESTQYEIDKLRHAEQNLPGTVPTLKKVIINYLLECENQGIYEVSLNNLYTAVRTKIEISHIKMKMDTLDNSIRGELNRHEVNSTQRGGDKLFVRIRKSTYALSDKGRMYNGR